MGIAVAFAAPQLAAFAWVAASADQLPGAIANTVAGAAAFSALFAALLGLAQSNGRRAMGFLVMSQTNLVLTGIGSQSAIARSGAVFTWQSLCVAFAGFAMALAAIEARRGGLLLVAGRGNHAATPRLAAAVLIFGLACVGMPLTPGFTGEDLLLQGALSQGLQAAAIVATALNGITVLRIFLTVFSGRAPGTGEIDLRPSEVYVVGAVLAAMLAATALPRGLIAPASLRRAAIEPTGPSSGMISGNAEGKAKPHRSILPLVR